MADLNAPNLYELSGDDVTLSYSTTSINGLPRLTFGDRQFVGEEIRTRATDLGTEVTVTLDEVPDQQTVTLTLLVPVVNLPDSAQADLDTVAVETTTRTSIGGPRLVTGAVQTYGVLALRGTARIVDF